MLLKLSVIRIIARKKIKKEVGYQLQLGQVVSFEVAPDNEIDLYFLFTSSCHPLSALVTALKISMGMVSVT